MSHTWDVVVRWEWVACWWYVTGLGFDVLLSFLDEEKDDVCMANDGMAEPPSAALLKTIATIAILEKEVMVIVCGGRVGDVEGRRRERNEKSLSVDDIRARVVWCGKINRRRRAMMKT